MAEKDWGGLKGDMFPGRPWMAQRPTGRMGPDGTLLDMDGRPKITPTTWSRDPQRTNRELNQFYGGNTRPMSPGTAGQGGSYSSEPPDDIPSRRPYTPVQYPPRGGQGGGAGAGGNYSAYSGLGQTSGGGLMQTQGGASNDPRWSHNGGTWNSGGGSIYGGGLMGQIGSAQATQGAQQYRAGTNQPSWGGGNVMGGMAQGQTTGTFTNAQGQTQSTLNGGARTMGSVNWGAVAGIQNYLNTINPAQRQQAEQYLASQGLMPSYNGMSLPQSQQMASTQGMGQLGGSGSPYLGGMSSAGGNNGYLAQQHQNWVNDFTKQNTDGGGNVMLQNAGGVFLDSTGSAFSGVSGGQQYSNGRLVGPAGGGGFGGAGGGGGFGGAGGGGGEYGGATFPLEGAMQDQIIGVLNNPSPYSQQQTQMMRNRSTTGIDQQRMEAQRQAGADAARRGLSPQEAAANQSALGASYDRTRQGVQQDFELNNALASRQGLMQGLGAGQGLLGQQFGREADIMRYLAILGQTQAGNPPAFVQSL